VNRFILTGIAAAGLAALAGSVVARADGNKLLYADFEEIKDGRPVSSRGGLVQLLAYQQSDPNKSTFKGLDGADPPAPELVRIKKDDPNRLAKFDYGLSAPNTEAGVSLEVFGNPEKDGKLVPDDISGYKDVSFQAFAKGVPKLRVELVSHGQDIEFRAIPPHFQEGYPQVTFKVREGLSTYKIALKAFSQPGWVDNRVDIKKILSEVTSVRLTAFCEDCTVNWQGTVAVDNITFEK
jgi:hypothetical protein